MAGVRAFTGLFRAWSTLSQGHHQLPQQMEVRTVRGACVLGKQSLSAASGDWCASSGTARQGGRRRSAAETMAHFLTPRPTSARPGWGYALLPSCPSNLHGRQLKSCSSRVQPGASGNPPFPTCSGALWVVLCRGAGGTPAALPGPVVTGWLAGMWLQTQQDQSGAAGMHP